MDFESKGTIIYNPVTQGISNPWWAIVECPMDIVLYYQHVVFKYTGIKLNKPLWGSHISIIRGEEPQDEFKHLWRKHHEKEVTFKYSTEMNHTDDYWWLEVECEELKNLREELGLNREPAYSLHLTIGKVIRPWIKM